MPLIDDVRAFVPGCEQETADRELILRRLEEDPGVWGRESPTHLTTSAWAVDARGERVLLVYHKIYDSWSWVGGHADGERAGWPKCHGAALLCRTRGARPGCEDHAARAARPTVDTCLPVLFLLLSCILR